MSAAPICPQTNQPACHGERYQRSAHITRCPLCGRKVYTDRKGRIRKHRKPGLGRTWR